MTHYDSNPEFGAPAGVRRIGAAMDELGRVERAGAPAALEERIFRATRRELPGAAGAEVVVGRVGFLTRARVAAGIAIVGTVGAVWLGQLAQPGGAGVALAKVDKAARLERDVEVLLALRNNEDGLDGVGEALDVLKLETDTVGDSLRSEWPSLLDGGAM